MVNKKAGDSLDSHAIKCKDGSIDEKAEHRAILKELKRLGLR
jgi:hypothetical protein